MIAVVGKNNINILNAYYETVKILRFDYEISSLSFNRDCSKIAFQLFNNDNFYQLKIYNIVTDEYEFEIMCSDFIEITCFSLDSSKILTICDQGVILTFDILTNEILSRIVTDKYAISFMFNPDGSKIFISLECGDIMVIDSTTCEELITIRNNRASLISFNSDGTQFLVKSSSKSIKIFDSNTGEVLNDVQFENEIYDCCFNKDSSLIITSDLKYIYIIDSTTFETLGSIRSDGNIDDHVLSSDGKYILYFSIGSNRLIICDIVTFEEVSTVVFENSIEHLFVGEEEIGSYI